VSEAKELFVLVNRKTMRVVCKGKRYPLYSLKILDVPADQIHTYTSKAKARQGADRYNERWLQGTDRRAVGRYEVQSLGRLKTGKGE